MDATSLSAPLVSEAASDWSTGPQDLEDKDPFCHTGSHELCAGCSWNVYTLASLAGARES